MTKNAAQLLEDVQANIARACTIARRKVDDVTLIAISKMHPAQAAASLLEAGHRVFGENRVQEAQEKWPALLDRYEGVELHLVGQLQSNKADDAVALFDVIHALDRPSLLNALAKAMDKAQRRVPCFVQVNIGAEEQKGGCAIADVPALLQQAREADIPLAGLMCVPPAGLEAAPFFALLDKIARDNGLGAGGAGGADGAGIGDGRGLSMGMSGDYETAIQLGATHIRVGTALFGNR